LFEDAPAALPGGASPIDAAVAVHADQQRRFAALPAPESMRLLVAAESACGLIAAEMTRTGVPVAGRRARCGAHRAARSAATGRHAASPPGRARRPDRRGVRWASSQPGLPAEVVQAFTRAGLPISSARSAVLRRLDHPAVAPLLEYKELSRLYAANGWSWLDTWVSGGRFRPDWVVGGVVSGRWASRGGGALQIPHALRRAVIAEPGHALVVADAAQLEPRILAALAGDERMAQAATASDLYSALAGDSFGGDRSRAKVAMLGTLYGATSGDAAPVLGVLRRRFPTAVAYVESLPGTARPGGSSAPASAGPVRRRPRPGERHRSGRRCPERAHRSSPGRGRPPGIAAGSPGTSSSRPVRRTGPR
jgi:DNA polymerase-1